MCVLVSVTPGQPCLPSSLRCHLHHVHPGHTGDVCSHCTLWNINSNCLRVWSTSQWWVKAIHPSDGWEVSPTSKKTLPHLFNCVGEGGCQQQPYKGWGGPHSGRASLQSGVKTTLQDFTVSWIWWVTGPSTLSGGLQPPEPFIHDRDQQNINILLFAHSECFINFPASGPNGNIHFYSLVPVKRYFWVYHTQTP